MDWRKLLDTEIAAFIKRNQDADVRQLALKKPDDASWPFMLILDQIKVRQKAKIKAPDLYETEGFIFPSGDVFEQASSTPCAKYKKKLASGGSFVDLTAGVGIDSFAFLSVFERGELVERDQERARILTHNLETLNHSAASKVHAADAESFLHQMESVDMIYIDPQRREIQKKGVFDFRACSPDVIGLLPLISKKSNKIIIKASPVADLNKSLEDLRIVSEVHVVEWVGDCKEVLYVLTPDLALPSGQVRITAVRINEAGEPVHQFSFTPDSERDACVVYSEPARYIYEPSAAFQKAGGFQSMAQTYDVKKLHKHTHLYTSDNMVENFPGRVYELMEIFSPSTRTLPVNQAEVSLRNYPGSVEDLRKKLKLKEGGNHRLFATTLSRQRKKLLLCKKIT